MKVIVDYFEKELTLMAHKIVILHSGGLDSTVMAELAKREYPLAEIIQCYFDIGHEYAWKEKQALPNDVEVFDMSWFQATGHGKEGNAMNNIFIPGRNMLFATLAATKYVPNEIWLGALCGEIHDQATDKNILFKLLMNNTLGYVLSPFTDNCKLVYPFVDRQWGKLQVTEWAVAHGLKDKVLQSSSCMNGEAGNCGKCGVCVRRAGIFMQLGLKEKYNVDPFTASETKKMFVDMIAAELSNDDSHYDKFRREEIIPALKLYWGTDSLEEIVTKYYR
jgi:7-cyano-7-deazaguanine synthase in queuosine biosynthesis